MPEHSSIDAVTEITDGLYLGTFAYARSLEWKNQFNIEMVVNLCEEAIPVSAAMTVEWLPMSDGEAVPADIIAKGLSAIERTLSPRTETGSRMLRIPRAIVAKQGEWHRIATTYPSASVALSPSWSPDSRRSAFGGQRAGEDWRPYVVSGDGGSPRLISESDGTDVTWSPDGHSVMFGLVNPDSMISDAQS